jgi:hypothetical protein
MGDAIMRAREPMGDEGERRRANGGCYTTAMHAAPAADASMPDAPLALCLHATSTRTSAPTNF